MYAIYSLHFTHNSGIKEVTESLSVGILSPDGSCSVGHMLPVALPSVSVELVQLINTDAVVSSRTLVKGSNVFGGVENRVILIILKLVLVIFWQAILILSTSSKVQTVNHWEIYVQKICAILEIYTK